MFTKESVDSWIAIQKSVVRPMAWTKKLNTEIPCWLMFESAIEVIPNAADPAPIVPQGLLVRCQWKPRVDELPSNFSIALFLGKERLYAIDVNKFGRHTNNCGNGRPLYKQVIGGIHEHTWSDDGYGYAEPIDESLVEDFEIAWRLFLTRANLECDHAFVAPGPEKDLFE